MRIAIPISPEVPFVRLPIQGIQQFDALLAQVARPFGVRVRSAPIRWFLFIVAHAVIYWLASGRELFGYGVDHQGAIWLLVFAWLSMVAIGWAWGKNEKRRSDIAHKLVEEALPDRLPDLLTMAAVSRLQILVIFPMLFWRLSLGEENQLFSATAETTSWDWILFTVAAWLPQVPFAESFSANAEVASSFASGIEAVQGAVQELFPGVEVTSADMIGVLNWTVFYIVAEGFHRVLKIQGTRNEVLSEKALRNGHENATRMGCRAVNRLRRQLKNSDEVVQIAASRALGEIGDSRAVDDLLKVLEGNDVWPVRKAAAVALGQIGDAKAVPELMKCLLDDGQADSASIRNSVARSLGQLGDSRAVGPLLQRLNRYQEDLTCQLEQAKTVLFDGGANSPQFEIDYEKDLYDSSGNKLGTCHATVCGRVVNGGTDVDNDSKWPFIEIQTEDERCDCVFLRIDDLQPLDSQTGPQTGVKIQAAYDFVRNGINGFYSDDQIVAALGRIGDPQASPRLVELIREADSLPGIKWLGDEQVEAFREHIVLALQRVGDPTAAEGLLSVLDGDFSESLKQQAAVALGQLFAPDSARDPANWTEAALKEVNSRYDEWVNNEPSSNAKAIREKVDELRFRLDRSVDEMDNHLRVVATSLRGPKPRFSVRIGHERMSVDEIIDGHTLRVQRGTSGLPRSHSVGGDVFVLGSHKWGATTRRVNQKSIGVLRSVAGVLLVGVLGVLGANQVLSGNGNGFAESDFGNSVTVAISEVHQALGVVLPEGTAVDSTLFLSVLYGVPSILLLMVLTIGRGGRRSPATNRPGSAPASPSEPPDIEPKVEVPEEPVIAVAEEPMIAVAEEPVIAVAEEPVIAVAEEPELAVTEEPVIVVAEEPIIAVAEEPVLVVADEPVIEVADELVIEPAIELADEVVFEPAIDVTDSPVLEVSDEPLLEHDSEADMPLLEGVEIDEPGESPMSLGTQPGGDDEDDEDDLDAFLGMIGEDL